MKFTSMLEVLALLNALLTLHHNVIVLFHSFYYICTS